MQFSFWSLVLLPLVSSDGFAPTTTLSKKPSSSTSTQLFVDGQGMAGGTRHLLGDIIRSLQPRYLTQVADAVQSNVKGMVDVNVDAFCETLDSANTINSWEQLEETLGPVKFAGPARATTRLFGQSSKPIVTLYRDSAAWCPYCQKVWMALEEKQVPYEIVKIVTDPENRRNF
jgi:hypothetical protein